MMRYMPTVLTDPITGKRMPTPTISVEKFWQTLQEIAQRELTPEEITRTEKMVSHRWMLRVIATELFGEDIVDSYYGPKPINE